MTRLNSRITYYILFLIILGLGVLFTLPQAALAQDEPVSDDAVNEVAKDIYCPVCENTPLDVCATQACADWRELIREKLGEGQTQEEIFNYFARQYGDGVLANPPSRGVNLLILWVLPVVFILVGALIFMAYIRNLRTTEADGAIAATAVSAPLPDSVTVNTTAPKPQTPNDYTARVEDELRGKSE